MLKEPDVTLTVGGKRYGGWEEITVTRSMESLSGGYALTVFDKFAEEVAAWPIREGDDCSVQLKGTTVITGFVDSRNIQLGKQEHSITIAGRDKAADLVDSSAILKGKWQFFNQNALAIAQALAAPYGIKVRLAEGVTLPPAAAQFPINPGESSHDALERACRQAGVLAISDGMGGILLTRGSSARAGTEIIEGGNLLRIGAKYDNSQRYHQYIVAGQHTGGDELNGEAASAVDASAYDENVRKGRVLLVHAEGIVTTAGAQKRAEWEATVRAARSGTVEVTVQGWTMGDGKLWPLNALVRLRSPTVGIDGDMLITEAEHSLGDAGTLTRLSLKRPQAYLPEPVIGVKQKKKKKPLEGDPWGVKAENATGV